MVKPLDNELNVPISDCLRKVVAEGLKTAYVHGQNDATQRMLDQLESVRGPITT